MDARQQLQERCLTHTHIVAGGSQVHKRIVERAKRAIETALTDEAGLQCNAPRKTDLVDRGLFQRLWEAMPAPHRQGRALLRQVRRGLGRDTDEAPNGTICTQCNNMYMMHKTKIVQKPRTQSQSRLVGVTDQVVRYKCAQGRARIGSWSRMACVCVQPTNFPHSSRIHCSGGDHTLPWHRTAPPASPIRRPRWRRSHVFSGFQLATLVAPSRTSLSGNRPHLPVTRPFQQRDALGCPWASRCWPRFRRQTLATCSPPHQRRTLVFHPAGCVP